VSNTIQSVPMFFPPAFNLTTAQTCAALVNAAYDQYDQFVTQNTPKPPEFTWNWTGPSTISNPQPIWWIAEFFASEPIGFLASDGAGNGYLVFRGTMSNADKIEDAKFGQTPYALVTGFGNVDEGYYSIYTNLSLPTAAQSTLLSAIDSLTNITTFYFTGHSLGAGLSSLAVPDVSSNSSLKGKPMVHYNFGSPRVGDITFAVAMNVSSGVPTYRVVNTEDLVPIAPTPVSATGPMVYQHLGTPVDFTANYGSAIDNHSMRNTYTYALTYPANPYNSNYTPNPKDGTAAVITNQRPIN